MSEQDSLSDSEWLEISSNQESDNDSISSRDSDHDDLASVPPSRRSSMSLGSSVDGEIDAWEGFADDSLDDPVAGVHFAVAAGAAAEHAASPDGVSEDQLVAAALEQSMVGTLSASRSSSLGVSSTVHNSLRDLRLSFPDPLTSSRDELNRSYEAISSTETQCITDDDSNSPMTTAAFPGQSAPICEESPLKDESTRHIPVDLETLSEPDSLPVQRWDGRQINGFDIIVYGSTVQSRDFTQWLVSIVATIRVHRPLFSEPMSAVRDGSLNAPSSQTLDKPSLAIISLPSSVARLPEHTLYLPVLLPANDASQAYESWAILDIPAIQTLRLIDSHSLVVVDGPGTRKRTDPKFVYSQLESVLASHYKKAPGLLEQFRPVHAVTFVALLSLIMSFAINTAFRASPMVPTPAAVSLASVHTTPSTFWNMFGTTPNSSVAPLPTAPSTGSMAIMPSTLKDFALAVFHPVTTTPVQVGSLSVAPATSGGACGPGTTGSPVGDCKVMTLSERTKSTTDVILRPSTALSNPSSAKAPPSHTPLVSGSIGKVSAIPAAESAPAVTSLSLKVVGSLSHTADATMKALEEVVARDFRELMAALDNLMRAIGRQTSMIVADSKSRAQILRERLQYRNERAKGKARELKQMGEQFVSIAGERLKARAEIAKTRAHSLKKTVMSTSVWRHYAQAHGEWSSKLETKRGRRREGRREHRVGLFAKLKQRRENRKKRVVST
ncbi:hypothetical protein C8R43DRAFT_980380 [Mycena crocata]|nr:hypothetical protein C8R43DRAFT_980380 [Mycena crocata]